MRLLSQIVKINREISSLVIAFSTYKISQQVRVAVKCFSLPHCIQSINENREQIHMNGYVTNWKNYVNEVNRS